MFQIFIKLNNEADWELYGTFQNDAEWQKEEAHIALLRSIAPIYLKRVIGKRDDSKSQYGSF